MTDRCTWWEIDGERLGHCRLQHGHSGLHEFVEEAPLPPVYDPAHCRQCGARGMFYTGYCQHCAYTRAAAYQELLGDIPPYER